MHSIDFAQLFISHLPISGVQFEHNDCVQITSGKYKGKCGSLVSLCKLEPEPLFLLELESGFDIEVLQSEIKSINF